MPIGTTQNNSVVSTAQQSPGSIRTIALNLKNAAGRSQDAALWSSNGDALSSVQSQLDHLWNALKQNLPITNPVQVFSPSGSLVAEIGDFLDPSNNTSYEGIWANNLYAGGTGPASAEFIVTPSGITITNVKITETGPGGTIVLDPAVPDIVITSTANGSIKLDATIPAITLTSPAANNPKVLIQANNTTASITLISNSSLAGSEILIDSAEQFINITNASSQSIAALGRLDNVFPGGAPANTIGIWTQNAFFGGADPNAALITCNGTTGAIDGCSLQLVSGTVTITIDGTHFILISDSFGPTTSQMTGSVVAVAGTAQNCQMNSAGVQGSNVGGGAFFLTPSILKVSGLPAANPGIGTKQLWYDPADANRVKFAP